VTGDPLPLPDPPIGTDRWTLRPWSERDARALHRAWLEPSIATATAVPEDPSPERARHWISGQAVRRQRGAALDLAIVTLAEGQGADQVLGEIGIAIVDSTRRWAEVGWWLFPEARGAGIAGDVLARFASRITPAANLVRLFARIPITNTPSERVAGRAGFDRIGITDDDLGIWVFTTPIASEKDSATVPP